MKRSRRREIACNAGTLLTYDTEAQSGSILMSLTAGHSAQEGSRSLHRYTPDSYIRVRIPIHLMSFLSSIVLKTEQGEEKANRCLAPETSDEEIFYWVEDTLGRLNDRLKAILVYRGADLIHAEAFEAR